LLDLTGFNCSNLKLVVVKVCRKDPLVDRAKSRLLNFITASLLQGREINEENLGLKVHVLGYSREDAMKEVLWAKDYWLLKRGPIPTSSASKCRVCEVRETCQKIGDN
jgi:hypothetical protein